MRKKNIQRINIQNNNEDKLIINKLNDLIPAKLKEQIKGKMQDINYNNSHKYNIDQKPKKIIKNQHKIHSISNIKI